MRLLIGTYTRGTASAGIYSLRWDGREGSIRVEGVAAAADNPSYLLWSHRHSCVYAANEVNDFDRARSGTVSRFVWVGDNLELRERQASGGGTPCALALDAAEENLAVANYAGSLAALPIGGGGSLGASLRPVEHPAGSVHPKRQTSGHPHGVTFVHEELRVPDLGADAVFRYRIDGQQIREHAPRVHVAPGSGPRLWVEHPSNGCGYLVNELANTLIVYRRDGVDLASIQQISTLAQGFAGRSAAADIHLSEDGHHLYVSNRGENSIAAFRISFSGELLCVARTPSGGAHPRAFALSPDGNWLLVANRDAGNVVVFRRDRTTGELSGPVSEVALPAPACLLFVP